MQVLILKAPAKINLYLNVLAKRADGFHNVETIFEKINLYDKVSLAKRKQGIKVFCQHSNVPQGKSNLGFRAAELLLAKTDCNAGVTIRITKNIPVAAGLGGGSSDAASVLLGLNRLLCLRQTQRDLLQIAEKLGSDVPFFLLRQFRAIGRGKGERLTPIKLKSKNWYVLVVPRSLAISTRQMYQDPRIALTKPPAGVKIVLRAIEEGNLTSFNKYSYNSFEPILIKRFRQIEKTKKALKTSGVKAALLSGSGPCVFGITKSRKEALQVKKKIQSNNRAWQVIVAKTLDGNDKSIT